MSSNNITLERIFEPRLVVNGTSRYIAMIGAMSVQYQTSAATSVSQTRLSWSTINPPGGVRTILGRKIYITTHVSLEFTAAAGSNTGNILKPGCDGLRAYPYASCLDTIECKLNGRSNISDMIHARSRYFNHETKSLNLSMSASMKDRTQEYSDLYIGVNNPFGILGDSGLFAGETRGAVARMNVVTNTPTSAQVDMLITEPLFLFPFEFATNANETGMCQVN